MTIKFTQKTLCTPKNQSGLTLVELMISMVVGLFLLAGVVTNFLSTSKADTKRVAISEMDSNAAAAFQFLRKSISHAGYPSLENTPMESPFYITRELSTKDFEESSTCLTGVARDKFPIRPNRTTRDGTGKDFLTVVSLADNPCLPGKTRCDGPSRVADINPAALVFTDCNGGGAQRNAHSVACSTDPNLGMPDSRDARIYSSFWLKKNISSDEDRTLYCDGSRGGSQPIINDVESIQYLYGVRDAEGQTNYRTAKQVTVADQWGIVASVQVGLLMRSSQQYVLDTVATKTRYNLLKTNIDIHARDSRRLFRVYTTTINLENRQ